MCSRDSNVKRSTIRVPPPWAASRTATVVIGLAIGAPCWSAKPSVKSSSVGGCTALTRHQPRIRSPAGPVMKYATSPPG